MRTTAWLMAIYLMTGCVTELSSEETRPEHDGAETGLWLGAGLDGDMDTAPAAVNHEAAEQPSATLTSAYAQIVNGNSYKCLSVDSSSTANGAAVIQWTCAGVPAQLWATEPHPAGGGWFYVKNLNSGKCLSIDYNSTANGARVTQWDCIGASSQKWKPYYINMPYFDYWGYHIMNGSNRCLAIGNGNTTNGAAAIQWDCLSTSWSQQWDDY